MIIEIHQNGEVYFGYSLETSGFPLVENEEPLYHIKIPFVNIKKFSEHTVWNEYLLVYYLNNKNEEEDAHFSFFENKKTIQDWVIWRNNFHEHVH